MGQSTVKTKIRSARQKNKDRFSHPLSGFLICADCGCKMKMNTSVHNNKRSYSFNCGDHMRFGKALCFSHHIMAKDIESVILNDIREMAQRIVLDEEQIKQDYLRHNAELSYSFTTSYQSAPFTFSRARYSDHTASNGNVFNSSCKTISAVKSAPSCNFLICS